MPSAAYPACPLACIMDDDFDAEAGSGQDEVEMQADDSKPAKRGKAKAKSKAAAKHSNKDCAVPDCDENCRVGSKFCQMHKRSADAMLYQASQQ